MQIFTLWRKCSHFQTFLSKYIIWLIFDWLWSNLKGHFCLSCHNHKPWHMSADDIIRYRSIFQVQCIIKFVEKIAQALALVYWTCSTYTCGSACITFKLLFRPFLLDRNEWVLIDTIFLFNKLLKYWQKSKSK